MNDYQKFLADKLTAPVITGFDIEESELNPFLSDFQRTIVKWALKRGRAALFEDTGLSEVFTDWLWVNGWHCECFDYGSYMIIPAVALDRLGEAA